VLTDGQGRTVDFRNTILIMTSNLGSEFLLSGDVESAREDVMGAVRAAFRPEFLNRIDELILFRRLEEQHMGAIVGIQLGRLERLLADRRMALELDDTARDWLAAKGYDPAYGARPLKRVIQKELQDPLARLILEGALNDGERIKVSTEGDVLTVNGRAVSRNAHPPKAAVIQ